MKMLEFPTNPLAFVSSKPAQKEKPQSGKDSFIHTHTYMH